MFTDAHHAPQRARVSLHLLPLLLERCQTALRAYEADTRLVGSALPFARVRTEEVTYILSNLLEMHTSPEAVAKFAPTVDMHVESPRAHLLALYGSLLSLACRALPLAQTRDGRASYTPSIVNEGLSTIGTSMVLAAPPTLPPELPAALFRMGRVGTVRPTCLSRPDLLAHQCLILIGRALGLPA